MRLILKLAVSLNRTKDIFGKVRFWTWNWRSVIPSQPTLGLAIR